MPFLESNYTTRRLPAAPKAPVAPVPGAPASAPTTVTPQNPGSIWADPAFAAFQRSINGSIDAATGSQALQGAAAQQALQMQLAGIQDQTNKGIDRAAVSAAGQGTWSSGARLQDQANVAQAGGAQAAGAQFGVANRQAESAASLADMVANLRQKAAERGLEYAENMYANQELN